MPARLSQAEILRQANNILNEVYKLISDGSDILQSDWGPVGSTASDEFINARSAYWTWAGETKTAINELKNQLGDGIEANRLRHRP